MPSMASQTPAAVSRSGAGNMGDAARSPRSPAFGNCSLAVLPKFWRRQKFHPAPPVGRFVVSGIPIVLTCGQSDSPGRLRHTQETFVVRKGDSLGRIGLRRSFELSRRRADRQDSSQARFRQAEEDAGDQAGMRPNRGRICSWSWDSHRRKPGGCIRRLNSRSMTPGSSRNSAWPSWQHGSSSTT